MLEWELTEADEPRVANFSLPISGSQARLLLRGEKQPGELHAAPSEAGRFADLIGLGWATLYAVSPKFSSCVRDLSGVSLIPVQLNHGPVGYALLGAIGRCGRVDYSRSEVIERSGKFMTLRGLHVTEPTDAVDFAIPSNRESILISSRAAAVIRSARLDNVGLVRLDAVEFDISEDMIKSATDGGAEWPPA